MDVEWFKLLFNYGVPTGLFLLFMVGLYRLVQQAGNFFAPIAKDVAAKHMQMIDTISTVGSGLLDQQTAQTALMKSQGQSLDVHGNKIEGINKKVDEIHKTVVKQ